MEVGGLGPADPALKTRGLARERVQQAPDCIDRFLAPVLREECARHLGVGREEARLVIEETIERRQAR